MGTEAIEKCKAENEAAGGWRFGGDQDSGNI